MKAKRSKKYEIRLNENGKCKEEEEGGESETEERRKRFEKYGQRERRGSDR